LYTYYLLLITYYYYVGPQQLKKAAAVCGLWPHYFTSLTLIFGMFDFWNLMDIDFRDFESGRFSGTFGKSGKSGTFGKVRVLETCRFWKPKGFGPSDI
jgi:hypothetical protein